MFLVLLGGQSHGGMNFPRLESNNFIYPSFSVAWKREGNVKMILWVLKSFTPRKALESIAEGHRDRDE